MKALEKHSACSLRRFAPCSRRVFVGLLDFALLNLRKTARKTILKKPRDKDMFFAVSCFVRGVGVGTVATMFHVLIKGFSASAKFTEKEFLSDMPNFITRLYFSPYAMRFLPPYTVGL